MSSFLMLSWIQYVSLMTQFALLIYLFETYSSIVSVYVTINTILAKMDLQFTWEDTYLDG